MWHFSHQGWGRGGLKKPSFTTINFLSAHPPLTLFLGGNITEHHFFVTTHSREIHVTYQADFNNCFFGMLSVRKNLTNSPDQLSSSSGKKADHLRRSLTASHNPFFRELFFHLATTLRIARILTCPSIYIYRYAYIYTFVCDVLFALSFGSATLSPFPYVYPSLF